MLDPQREEIKPLWNSELHLDETLLLRAHLVGLLQEPSMDGHVGWSAPHVTDMQAATSHVQSGDVKDEAAMRASDEVVVVEEENEESPEAEIENPEGKKRTWIGFY